MKTPSISAARYDALWLNGVLVLHQFRHSTRLGSNMLSRTWPGFASHTPGILGRAFSKLVSLGTCSCVVPHLPLGKEVGAVSRRARCRVVAARVPSQKGYQCPASEYMNILHWAVKGHG